MVKILIEEDELEKRVDTTVDKQGRISIGKKYANKRIVAYILLKDIDEEVISKFVHL